MEKIKLRDLIVRTGRDADSNANIGGMARVNYVYSTYDNKLFQYGNYTQIKIKQLRLATPYEEMMYKRGYRNIKEFTPEVKMVDNFSII